MGSKPKTIDYVKDYALSILGSPIIPLIESENDAFNFALRYLNTETWKMFPVAIPYQYRRDGERLNTVSRFSEGPIRIPASEIIYQNTQDRGKISPVREIIPPETTIELSQNDIVKYTVNGVTSRYRYTGTEKITFPTTNPEDSNNFEIAGDPVGNRENRPIIETEDKQFMYLTGLRRLLQTQVTTNFGALLDAFLLGLDKLPQRGRASFASYPYDESKKILRSSNEERSQGKLEYFIDYNTDEIVITTPFFFGQIHMEACFGFELPKVLDKTGNETTQYDTKYLDKHIPPSYHELLAMVFAQRFLTIIKAGRSSVKVNADYNIDTGVIDSTLNDLKRDIETMKKQVILPVLMWDS